MCKESILCCLYTPNVFDILSLFSAYFDQGNHPLRYSILIRCRKPSWLLAYCIRRVHLCRPRGESYLPFTLFLANVELELSTAAYQHCINRLTLITKSALVGIIHAKTMQSPSATYDNGEATTLMSTDADSLGGIGGIVHETWAQVVEVIIGIRLLALEVGWIWPLPLFLIYC
jgi:hypothetical protein